jgi:hypothetical protein
MVVLQGGDITQSGTMSKIYFQPTDNVYKVQERLTEYIDENRKENPDNGTEKIISALLSVPGLLRGGVKILRWMDKHGMLPKFVIKASPFHTSAFLTNVASLGIDAIFHHLYDFGTTGLFLAMGKKKKSYIYEEHRF